ncbi:hypothetical protein GQR36_01790 [Enterococcus termitis]
MTNSVLEQAMEYIDLNQTQLESLVMLLDCLTYTASYPAISKEAKEETLDTLVYSIADYIEKNTN